MLVVFSMKWLTSVLRRVVCLMLIQYTMGPTDMAPCRVTSKPHCWLKWQKINLVFPSPVSGPVMKLPNRLQILCQTFCVNLLQTLKLGIVGNTLLAGEVLVQHHGPAVLNVIASCRDLSMACWMKAITLSVRQGW